MDTAVGLDIVARTADSIAEEGMAAGNLLVVDLVVAWAIQLWHDMAHALQHQLKHLEAFRANLDVFSL